MMKKEMKRRWMTALWLLVVCLTGGSLVACGGSDDDGGGSGNSYDGSVALEGTIWKVTLEGIYICYYVFDTDGTCTYYNYDYDYDSDNGTYKQSYSLTFYYYPDEEHHGYYHYDNPNNADDKGLLNVTYHEDGSYLIHFGDYLGSGSSWNGRSVTREYSCPSQYSVIYEDGTPYTGGGGSGGGTGGGQTEEWQKVSASGYLPYWYCPTDRTTTPSTLVRSSDVAAYKNTTTGAYKVTWAGKEYTASKGHNKITLDREAHSVYNSRTGHYTSCTDYYYYEFTISE